MRRVSKVCLCRDRELRAPFCHRREEGSHRREDSPWEGKPSGSRKERGMEGIQRRARLGLASGLLSLSSERLWRDRTNRLPEERPFSRRSFCHRVPGERSEGKDVIMRNVRHREKKHSSIILQWIFPLIYVNNFF